MQNLNEHNITDEVVRRFKHVPKPRLQEIMTSLIKHLHEFAREVHLTEDEWFQGIQFVTNVGQKCDDRRQEFILLSDTLGLSQLVVAQNHNRPHGVTEQTVFGPSHLTKAPHLPHGANIAEGVAGEPCFVSALVKLAQGASRLPERRWGMAGRCRRLLRCTAPRMAGDEATGGVQD